MYVTGVFRSGVEPLRSDFTPGADLSIPSHDSRSLVWKLSGSLRTIVRIIARRQRTITLYSSKTSYPLHVTTIYIYMRNSLVRAHFQIRTLASRTFIVTIITIIILFVTSFFLSFFRFFLILFFFFIKIHDEDEDEDDEDEVEQENDAWSASESTVQQNHWSWSLMVTPDRGTKSVTYVRNDTRWNDTCIDTINAIMISTLFSIAH